MACGFSRNRRTPTRPSDAANARGRLSRAPLAKWAAPPRDIHGKRKMARPSLVLFPLIFGCSIACTTPDPASGAEPPQPPSDASEVEAPPRTVPQPRTTLPIGSSQVTTVASGGLFMPGATFGLDAGAFLAVAPR